MADVRIHATTHQRPADRFEDERGQLKRLNPNGYDLGTIKTVRATSTCRVPLESNHYSVPPHLAGQRLTLKAYPDRVCVYHHDQLQARHARSLDRHRDIEDPEHVRVLQAQRASAREQRPRAAPDGAVAGAVAVRPSRIVKSSATGCWPSG